MSGPGGLGLLRTAPGIGAALCALVLALSPIGRHVGAWMFGGVAVFGVATIVFGVSTNFMLSLCALTVLGAADMVSVYVRHLLVQLETPDEIRGRVSAVSAVFIGASNELGDFESGLTAKWWGAVRAVVVGGVATLRGHRPVDEAVSRALAHGPVSATRAAAALKRRAASSLVFIYSSIGIDR